MAGRPDRARPAAASAGPNGTGPPPRPPRRGRPPPPPPPRPAASVPAADCSPLSWAKCFDGVRYVEARGARFAFYTSGLSAAGPAPRGPVLVLLHGAGCTALSFACLARSLGGAVPLAALDLRGHGSTTEAGPTEPLTAAALVADVVGAVRGLFAGRGADGEGGAAVPGLVLVGHSMGGAVAARVAHSGQLPVLATALIDVVEGTALAALPHMAAWLSARPSSFMSVEAAVRYVTAKGHVRNLDSARRSVPSQLVPIGTRWGWRTDLAATHACWRGWFAGLSEVFLACPGPKLLILAGVDRLDRALTIAQMQGKFQNILIPDAGHSIAEDQPEKTAAALLDFLRRNALIEAVPENDEDCNPVFQQRQPITTSKP